MFYKVKNISFLHFCDHNPESVLEALRATWEYNLDGTSVHRRAPCTPLFTHRDNLAAPIYHVLEAERKTPTLGDYAKFHTDNNSNRLYL